MIVCSSSRFVLHNTTNDVRDKIIKITKNCDMLHDATQGDLKIKYNDSSTKMSSSIKK